MPLRPDEILARVLRLQAERENIVYALANVALDDRELQLLKNRLLIVQGEIVRLTGGISLN